LTDRLTVTGKDAIRLGKIIRRNEANRSPQNDIDKCLNAYKLLGFDKLDNKMKYKETEFIQFFDRIVAMKEGDCLIIDFKEFIDITEFDKTNKDYDIDSNSGEKTIKIIEIGYGVKINKIMTNDKVKIYKPAQ